MKRVVMNYNIYWFISWLGNVSQSSAAELGLNMSALNADWSTPVPRSGLLCHKDIWCLSLILYGVRWPPCMHGKNLLGPPIIDPPIPEAIKMVLYGIRELV